MDKLKGSMDVLNAIMYPHGEDFIGTISDYIDFSENEELWKENPHMFSLSQCVFEDGLVEGIEQGIEALIRNNLQEGIPKERTIENLSKFYGLTKEKAEEYFVKAAEKQKNQEFI